MVKHPRHYIISTERLTLSPWLEEDLWAVSHFCSDPRVMAYVGDGSPWQQDRCQQFLDEETTRWNKLGYCRFALCLKTSDPPVPIGFCGFVPDLDGIEIGWRIAHQHWGKGLATEATQAALEFAEKELDAGQVVATIQLGNEASRRVASKCGFTLRQQVLRGGSFLELWIRQLSPPSREVNIT